MLFPKSLDILQKASFNWVCAWAFRLFDLFQILIKSSNSPLAINVVFIAIRKDTE